jgi:P-type E1-E2 ATPase
MLTGDNAETANQIAEELGITDVYPEMLPADKIHVIEKFKHRPIVFVGDGVNDSPALTAADVGIALGARGSTAASESADIVIMLDDLGKVATALAIAKRTFKIARQSILAGIGMSVVLMIIFATGKFSPLEGAIIQEIVDVFVIFNALRAHLITEDS